MSLQTEIRRLLAELEQLKEKSVRTGNTQFAARLVAMSTAAHQPVNLTAESVINSSANCKNKLENGPPALHKESDKETRKKSNRKEKNKSPKHSLESGTSLTLYLFK